MGKGWGWRTLLEGLDMEAAGLKPFCLHGSVYEKAQWSMQAEASIRVA